jgi:hypothetical protein
MRLRSMSRLQLESSANPAVRGIALLPSRVWYVPAAIAAFTVLFCALQLDGLTTARASRVIGRFKGYHSWALQKIPADSVLGGIW